MSERQVFHLFRIKDFQYFAATTVLSNAAQWIQQVTVNWLIYEITRSGTWLGSLNFSRGIASLLVIPFIGWFIDRSNRKKLVIGENAVLLTMTLIIGLALLSHHCGMREIFVFSIVAGICHIMDLSLRQVLVFDVVPRELVPNAILIIQIGWALMRSLGPALGGFLILWFGAGGNFLTQSAIYGSIILVLWKIPLVNSFSNNKTDPFYHKFSIREVFQGINFVASTPQIRTFVFMGLILPLFVIPIFVILMPIYAKDVFKVGPEFLGLLMSAVGIGGLTGGLIMTLVFNKVRKKGLLQIWSLFALGLSLTAFAFSVEPKTAICLLFLAGFFEMIVLTTNRTVLQLSMPDEIRGRVTTLVNSEVVLVPLTALGIGVLNDLLHGPVLLCATMGLTVSILAILFYLISPQIRQFRM